MSSVPSGALPAASDGLRDPELPEQHERPVTKTSSSSLARWWTRYHLIVLTAVGGALILTAWIVDTAGFAFASRFLYVAGYLTGGWIAAKESLEGLARRSLDVNLLMTIAAIGAAIIGEWAEGGTLIFLFSLSNTLEHFALEKTKSAVKSLMDLRPAEARRLTAGHSEHVPVEALRVNDEILIKPGEKIPADGTIIDGRTSLDRSTFTGESMPVEAELGDDVLAGTINLTGQISVRVTRRADDTALAAIIHRVEQAQSGRVPANSFVAWFGQRYTIFVLVGASALAVLPPLLLGSEWGASLYRSLTLLVVASPCALIISTPAAVLSALARAAKRRLLFKGGAHLLSMGTIRALALDKTGTLTQARAVVTDVVPLNGTEPETLLRLAAAVESGSVHPLAQAILNEAHRLGLSVPPIESATTTAGHGADGVVKLSGKSQTIHVGNRLLFASRGILVGPEDEEAMRKLESEGKTAVLVGGEVVLGIIAMEDPPRPSAKTLAAQLHKVGVVSVSILTGDNERVAQAMARRLSIDDVQAELLPGHKADAVAKIKAEHQFVGVVGDGVNDAPALASATIGIAMGGAKNDVILETADVVLIGDDLGRLPYAIRLSKATRRTITQNLVFALCVIVVLLASTLFGELPLTLGVIGHEGSTLLVVLNSLRLLWFE